MRGRLDDEKLETLRSWGTGLSADGRDELRAAGKAILILIEEIEQLQVDMWHASQDGAEPGTPATGSSTGAASDDDDTSSGMDSTLRIRLGRLLPARSPDGA